MASFALAGLAQPVGEVVAGGERVGVVGSEDAEAVGEESFVLVDGLVHPPGLCQPVDEVVAGGERVGVVGSEDAEAVGEEGFVLADGLVHPPDLS